MGPPLAPSVPPALGGYRVFRHRLDSDPKYIVELAPEYLPPVADVFNAVPNRWALNQPDYRRYPQKGEYVYTKSRWYDPFNRNRFKGDEPIWPELLGQQVFLNFTASSETFFDGRRVPSPSNVSAAQPGSSGFFGRGEQAFVDQTLRFSFDLFHGDTSFRPVDWRIRVTPAVSINYLDVRELGIVNIDVPDGTTRLDAHLGLAGGIRRIKIRRSEPELRFPLGPRGHPGIFQRFSRIYFCRRTARRAHIRKPARGPLGIQRRLFPTARKEHQQRPQHLWLPAPAGHHRQTSTCRISSSPATQPSSASITTRTIPSVHYDDNGFLGAARADRQLFQAWGGHRTGFASRTSAGPATAISGASIVNHAFYQALGTDTL